MKCIILFTDTLCDANGVSRFIQDMAKSALKEGKAFYIITSTRKTFCDPLENIHNINAIIHFKMPYYPELDVVIPNYFQAKKIVKQLRPDMIHVSTPGPVGMIGKRIAKKLKLPLGGVYHTDFPAYMKDNTKSETAYKVTNAIMRNFYRPFNVLFTRSKEYIPIMSQTLRFNEDDIHFLPSGTNTSKFSPTFKDTAIWKNYQQVTQESCKVLYVGRITKEKNVPFLLEIWQELKKSSHPAIASAQLIMLGEGLLEKEAKEYPDVILLGLKRGDELSRIYASSDLFIFPSVTDTLGQVVMEAQASGIPCIVSDEGGPQSMVNSTRGYILPTDDTTPWVDALQRLIIDEKKRQAMGQEAENFMQKNSIEATFKKFWHIHEETINAS